MYIFGWQLNTIFVLQGIVFTSWTSYFQFQLLTLALELPACIYLETCHETEYDDEPDDSIDLDRIAVTGIQIMVDLCSQSVHHTGENLVNPIGRGIAGAIQSDWVTICVVVEAFYGDAPGH